MITRGPEPEPAVTGPYLYRPSDIGRARDGGTSVTGSDGASLLLRDLVPGSHHNTPAHIITVKTLPDLEMTHFYQNGHFLDVHYVDYWHQEQNDARILRYFFTTF